jgi:hypothetical protein
VRRPSSGLASKISQVYGPSDRAHGPDPWALARYWATALQIMPSRYRLSELNQ